MAKTSHGKGGVTGGCLQRLLAAWIAALVLLLLLANLAFSPSVSGALGRPSVLSSPGGAARLSEGPREAAGERAGGEPVEPVERVQRSESSEPSEPSETSETSEPFENNAPRPPPREGDSELSSEDWNVRFQASQTHLHGLLGRDVDGHLQVPATPLPSRPLSPEELVQAHRGQCFNARASDSIPLDREQPDVRSAACRAIRYPSANSLPSASIVMVFHNEVASVLLRSVHSVLNHSPPEVLKEIILVDDASTPDPDRFTEERWARLQEWLSGYVKGLPKVRLVRLRDRRGLMLARMEGAWRAQGDVLIFLDSHIEATPGWIEPLLSRIQEDPRHVVVPSIDSIDFDSFAFQGGSGLGVVGFTWTLGQAPQAPSGPDTAFQRSPIMAGGLFAAHRAFFLHLGGYDPEMRFYGGEELEIGFRTWQCGGNIEFVPCSHVFHVFRECRYWQGRGSGGVAYMVPAQDILRNKLRTAAVWMDDFARLVEFASPPLGPGWSLGDLEPRRRLRAKLRCRDFAWYLKHVAPEMYVPKLEGLRPGALASPIRNACLDTLGSSEPGVYPCHGSHGTQGLVMDPDGIISLPVLKYTECLHAGSGDRLQLDTCPHVRSKGSLRQAVPHGFRWRLDPNTNHFIAEDGRCLEFVEQATPRSPYDVHLAQCVASSKQQEWVWREW